MALIHSWILLPLIERRLCPSTLQFVVPNRHKQGTVMHTWKTMTYIYHVTEGYYKYSFSHFSQLRLTRLRFQPPIWNKSLTIIGAQSYSPLYSNLQIIVFVQLRICIFMPVFTDLFWMENTLWLRAIPLGKKRKRQPEVFILMLDWTFCFLLTNWEECCISDFLDLFI